MSVITQKKFKELVLVLAIRVLLTETCKEAESKVQDECKIKYVLCIYYPTMFSWFLVETVIDSSGKPNAI